VDSNDFHYKPSEFLVSSELSIIQSASPHHKRLEWVVKTGVVSETFYMPPFTLEEAIVAYALWFLRIFQADTPFCTAVLCN
jgi:hypothetical protein